MGCGSSSPAAPDSSERADPPEPVPPAAPPSSNRDTTVPLESEPVVVVDVDSEPVAAANADPAVPPGSEPVAAANADSAVPPGSEPVAENNDDEAANKSAAQNTNGSANASTADSAAPPGSGPVAFESEDEDEPTSTSAADRGSDEPSSDPKSDGTSSPAEPAPEGVSAAVGTPAGADPTAANEPAKIAYTWHVADATYVIDEETTATGRKLLRGVVLDDISLELFQTDPGSVAATGVETSFYSYSKPLESVDFFVSHSWHDDNAEKFRILTEIATLFEATYGRKPTFWIDKFCINQSDLLVNLACLPYWVSVCKVTLVLWGGTYLGRLWCIWEIFVIIETHRKNMKALMDAGKPLKDLAMRSVSMKGAPKSFSFNSFLGKFRIREAKCFSPADQGEIFKRIEDSYAGTDHFARTMAIEFVQLGEKFTDPAAIVESFDQV